MDPGKVKLQMLNSIRQVKINHAGLRIDDPIRRSGLPMRFIRDISMSTLFGVGMAPPLKPVPRHAE